MNPATKKTIAIAAAVVLLLALYTGSYLPLRKGQLFIRASEQLPHIQSFDDFKTAVSVPLNAPSPIGQEELVRNTGSVVLNIVEQNGQNPELTSTATTFLNQYYAPIIARGRGMSFSQNLYIIGLINETAALKTKDGRYLDAAESYFEKGRALGPDRPQFLYGLFDTARIKGDALRAREIGEKILTLWPNDERVKSALSALPKATSTKK